MQLQDAIDLIEYESIGREPKIWADLGCGSGLFTRALAALLPADSVVYAIDQQMQYNMPTVSGQSIRIDFIQADFEKQLPELPKLDGVLMANALHYVADKGKFIDQLKNHLTDNASFLIVEYEMTKPNPWVPYPIPFGQLQSLFSGVGFAQVNKLGERPSAYRQGNMYAALIKK